MDHASQFWVALMNLPAITMHVPILIMAASIWIHAASAAGPAPFTLVDARTFLKETVIAMAINSTHWESVGVIALRIRIRMVSATMPRFPDVLQSLRAITTCLLYTSDAADE